MSTLASATVPSVPKSSRSPISVVPYERFPTYRRLPISISLCVFDGNCRHPEASSLPTIDLERTTGEAAAQRRRRKQGGLGACSTRNKDQMGGKPLGPGAEGRGRGPPRAPGGLKGGCPAADGLRSIRALEPFSGLSRCTSAMALDGTKNAPANVNAQGR